MQSWRQRLDAELELTSQLRELLSIAAFSAISFICIAATMGGLLIPSYFGGLIPIGVGRTGKIKRAGVG